MYRRALLAVVVFAVLAVVRAQQAPPGSVVDVLTRHNDNNRSGANLGETTLTADNVSPTMFGLLYSLGPLDGEVYAQPLYVSQLSTTAGVRNVLFVATEHNSVYAFDADGTQTTPLWQVNLGPSAPQDPVNDPANATIEGCVDLTPEIGITSTPVIDRASQTIYVVAKTKDAAGGFHYFLHAIALEDGRELRSVEVTATAVNGSSTAVFNAQFELNRPGLLLLNGEVYLAFGSHCDVGPYYGWVLGYDELTLQQTRMYLTTPTGTEGAVWQSGEGLAADAANNIYFLSSNGTNGDANVSDSFVELSTGAGQLTLADWFTPSDWAALNEQDADLGSGGALLIPGSNVVVGGGKEGRFYVLDRSNLGHETSDDSGAIQSFQLSDAPYSNRINGAPVYWASPAGGRMYVWPSHEHLKAFSFDGRMFNPAPIATSTATTVSPGGAIALSANGSTPRSGILWASVPASSANHQTAPGVLRAFDAEDITHELWNSEANPGDHVGLYAKFNPPTVVNGHVYLATFSGVIQVYGPGTFSGGGGTGGPLPSPWVSQDIGTTGQTGSASFDAGTFTVKGAGADIWGTSDAFQYVHQAITGDAQIVTRAIRLDDTNQWAKAGVMLRQSVAPDSPFVMLDVTPSGAIEFNTRTSAGASAVAVASAAQSPPVWLRLTRSGTSVTGEISPDGSTWSAVGTASMAAGGAEIGLIVCSHDVATLNTAAFDAVTLTSGGTGGGGSLPSPWSNQDVGSTGQAGNASFAGGTFTVNGAGADIWGTNDAFQFVDQPIAGDVTVAARVVSMQNTSQWAKAGVMLRTSTSPDAPFVMLDETPGGGLEFMTRTSAGAAVTFIASATQPAPAWVRLTRSGATVTAAASADGVTWNTVGSTAFVQGAAAGGLIVCSHDPATLNTATFDSVTVTASGSGGTLPAPWLSRDIGATGQTGAASYSSGTFTVKGAGTDIWGTSDAFQFVYQSVAGDTQLVSRVVSLQNTSPYAKAGIMLRASLDPNSPFVILDATPAGSIEFMTRDAAGDPVTFINSTSVSTPVWLRLVRAGTVVTGAVSSDGTNWTAIGTASAAAGSMDAGLIVCSHDPSTLNTAAFDSVSVSAGTSGGPAEDVVLYASDVASVHGSWTTASDATSPGGMKLVTSNTGISNADSPLPSPADYFDVTFNASANTPYTLWLRLQALNNDKFNDSVWVQFSDAEAGGTFVYPINSTSGLLVNLATDGTGSSLNGWGWQNTAYWLSQRVTVTFPTTGTHTVRVQVREDGVELDQIVLSPSNYLQSPPGPPENDSTIVPKP